MEMEFRIGQFSRGVAAVVHRDLDGQVRRGRVGRSHSVLHWNRDVAVPSHPKEPHRHGPGGREAEGGGEAADPFTQRDRLLFAWREPGRLGDCLGVS